MPTIIGITGPFGSGKTTAAKFFEEKGFTSVVLSSFLRDELRSSGKELTRKNLQDLGNLWREKNGRGVLASKALEYSSKNKMEKIVVDGIRNLGEIEELKKNSKFVLLGVFADREIRFNRIKAMTGRESLTRKEFNELDYRDLGIYEDQDSGLQVAKCFAISDYFIDSNNEDNYISKLEDFLKNL